MADGRRYSEEEVRAILERALRRGDASADGIAHDDLVAAAGEIGVSRADLERAAEEMAEGQYEREARARVLARRKSGFSAHLYAFLGVNAFLFAINWLTTPGIWWFLFPLLGWGLGLFFHTRVALSNEVSDRAVARELNRDERHKRRVERRVAAEKRVAEKHERKQRLEKGAAELGAAVEEGVGALLSKVAEEIRKKTDQAAPYQRSEAPHGPRVSVDPPKQSEPERDRAWAEAEAEAESEASEGARPRAHK